MTTLFFPPGSVDGAMDCAMIPIIPDQLYEKDENFTVHVVDVERNVMVLDYYTTVWIEDDDCTSFRYVNTYVHTFQASRNHRDTQQLVVFPIGLAIDT